MDYFKIGKATHAFEPILTSEDSHGRVRVREDGAGALPLCLAQGPAGDAQRPRGHHRGVGDGVSPKHVLPFAELNMCHFLFLLVKGIYDCWTYFLLCPGS